MAKFNRKQVEGAIELAQLQATHCENTAVLLRLMATQLQHMLRLIDRATKVAAGSVRERELSQLLSIKPPPPPDDLIDVEDEHVLSEFLETGEIVLGEPIR